MISRMISGCSRICGKSQGYLGLPIRDVVLDEKVNGSDIPAMQTPAELAVLNAGGSVLVSILGVTPAPMNVTVEGSPE